MKVKFEDSVRYKVLQAINSTDTDIILRKDLTKIDQEQRQISRALKELVKEGKIIKLGYGIYAKLNYSKLTKRTYLPKGMVSLLREALGRLDIPWELSQAEKDYNLGKSTQIPANPATKLLSRFRRTISYNGIEARFE